VSIWVERSLMSDWRVCPIFLMLGSENTWARKVVNCESDERERKSMRNICLSTAIWMRETARSSHFVDMQRYYASKPKHLQLLMMWTISPKFGEVESLMKLISFSPIP
jgi:hypothetical protein